MTSTSTAPNRSRLRKTISSPVAWTLLASAMAALLTGDAGASPLSWLIFVLFGSYLMLWWAAHRWQIRERLRIRGWLAVVVYLAVGFAGGVVYELTLTTGGTGYGGLHEDTGTSFLLLVGYLVPAVFMTLWITRRFRLNARELFFVSGAMCWFELLTVGRNFILGAPILTPPIVAFYVTSYAVYTGAIGLLLVQPNELWAKEPRDVGFARKIGYGLIAGGIAWITFVLWATLLGIDG